MTMFEDVLKEMPPDLVRQREELRALRAAQSAAVPSAPPAGHSATPPALVRKG